MWSKPSCMISTWSSKNFNSINKLLQKCKQIWFKTPEYLKNLKSHSITSLRNVKEASQMNWLLACTAEFTHQERLLSVTKAMLRKCTLLDKALLKSLTMKTTKSKRRNQFSIFLNTRTLETIKFFITWNQIWFSRPLLILLITKQLAHQNNSQTSFSCASPRMCYANFVICSHKLPKTSREDP